MHRPSALFFALLFSPAASRPAVAEEGPPPAPIAPSPPAAPPGGPAPATPPPPPPGAAPPALSPEEQKELEKAIEADRNAPKMPASAAPPSVASSVGAAVTRALQSLNPDMAVIIDFGAGYYSGLLVESGDDPRATGANLQELELAFQATVDPYFRADVFLTIPNLAGIEVEEAVLTTTSLPGSLQLRAGIFRAPFGRQNQQHLHLQDFTRRPELNALLLGPDGLRAPGGEVSWLVPVPFYLLVTAAVLSVDRPDDLVLPIATFGGGSRSDLTYLGNAKTFFNLTDNASALFGLSFATGNVASSDPEVVTAPRSYLYGTDLYVKWKPPNVATTYMSLAWTTEFMLRHVPDLDVLDGALYSQLLWQAARRWFLGVRGEIDGLPSRSSADNMPRQYAGAGSLTWQLSEFARVRLYGEVRDAPYRPKVPVEGIPPGWSWAGFLQIEASIGAHGAHPY